MEQKKEHQNHKLSNTLAILSIVLYVTGYDVCEYFYAEDLVEWGKLRDLLKGICILFLVLLNFLPRTILVKGVMISFWIYCASNLVDRLGYGITTFVNSDYGVHFIAVVAGIISYYYVKRRFNK